MKIFLTLVTLLFAATAQATPAVGDYAKFNVTSGAVSGIYEQTLTSLRSDGYVMLSVLTVNGQAQRDESIVAGSDLMTDATINTVLTDCAAYGGRPEQVVVPAGTFATCAFTEQAGTVWIAQVPFGVAKQTQKQDDGSLVTFELNTFTHGK